MHPHTSAVTVDQTADHQLLLMQSGLGTQKLRDQRRQMLLIEYSIHNNNKSFRKKVSESLHNYGTNCHSEKLYNLHCPFVI